MSGRGIRLFLLRSGRESPNPATRQDRSAAAEAANLPAPLARQPYRLANRRGDSMPNRILVWLSAGFLALGVFAGMVGRAGLAIADDHATPNSAGGSGSSPSPAGSSRERPNANAKGPRSSKTSKKGHLADDASVQPTTNSEDDKHLKDPR